MTNFIVGIAGTIITALLLGVGATLWHLNGEVRVLQVAVAGLAEDVKELTALVNQGRKWRWESGLGTGPGPYKDDK